MNRVAGRVRLADRARQVRSMVVNRLLLSEYRRAGLGELSNRIAAGTGEYVERVEPTRMIGGVCFLVIAWALMV